MIRDDPNRIIRESLDTTIQVSGELFSSELPLSRHTYTPLQVTPLSRRVPYEALLIGYDGFVLSWL